jgi:hypothetical protein
MPPLRQRLIEITSRQQQTQRALLDWLRVEYAIEKPSSAGKEEGRMQNDCYGLTPPEIELLWKTAPPRMSLPQPLGVREVPISLAEFVQ